MIYCTNSLQVIKVIHLLSNYMQQLKEMGVRGLVVHIRVLFVQLEALVAVVDPLNTVVKGAGGLERRNFAVTLTASINRVVGVVSI